MHARAYLLTPSGRTKSSKRSGAFIVATSDDPEDTPATGVPALPDHSVSWRGVRLDGRLGCALLLATEKPMEACFDRRNGSRFCINRRTTRPSILDS